MPTNRENAEEIMQQRLQEFEAQANNSDERTPSQGEVAELAPETQLESREAANDDKEFVKDEKLVRELVQSYDNIISLEQKRMELQKSNDESEARMAKISSKLGIDAQKPSETSEIDQMSSKIEKNQNQAEALENELLQLPEGALEQEQLSRKLESIMMDTQSLQESMLEQETGIEQAEEEMRKQIAEEFAQESAEYLLQQWDTVIQGSENSEQAQSYIAAKTRFEIIKQAQSFIETGEGIESLGFTAELSSVEFDGEEGKLSYVSELEFKFDGVTVSPDSLPPEDSFGKPMEEPQINLDFPSGQEGEEEKIAA